MGALLVTPPTLEPITLAEAKAHCNIETPDSDAVVAQFIFAARQWVEGQTHRALMTQTWDFTFNGDWPMVNGDLVLRLPMAPVQSVTSVTYVSDAGTNQTLSAALYRVITKTEHPRIVRAYDASLPAVRCQDESITVRAVCGYGDGQGDVPRGLTTAMKLLIAHWYNNRETVNIGNITTELEYTVEALISPYRRGFA